MSQENIKPIAIRLCCELCGKLHIDEGEFATKLHHTHSCQNCGLTWRPAKEYTVGVRFIPGFKKNDEEKENNQENNQAIKEWLKEGYI